MCGLGMRCSGISVQVDQLYGVRVSMATLSAITDKIIVEGGDWQQRPLEGLYPLVRLQAIYYKLKDDGRYKGKEVYAVLAVNLKGDTTQCWICD